MISSRLLNEPERRQQKYAWALGTGRHAETMPIRNSMGRQIEYRLVGTSDGTRSSITLDIFRCVLLPLPDTRTLVRFPRLGNEQGQLCGAVRGRLLLAGSTPSPLHVANLDTTPAARRRKLFSQFKPPTVPPCRNADLGKADPAVHTDLARIAAQGRRQWTIHRLAVSTLVMVGPA